MAWGEGAFDNDAATDWAYKLEASPDLSVVEAALSAVVDQPGAYIPEETGSVAIAAAEVVARLRGKPGLENAYTVDVDKWVREHPTKPSPELVAKANRAIDLVLGENSELRQLWDQQGPDMWLEAVEDLRSHLK